MLIVGLAYAFKIDAFTENATSILGTMIMFGLGFIPFLYMFAFIFKEVEAAFKYVTLPLMLFYAIPYLIGLIKALNKDTVNRAFMAISPLSCLSTSLSQLFQESSEDTDTTNNVPKSAIIIYQLIHFVIYFTIVIVIDHVQINSFKGRDVNEPTVERL